MPKQVDRWLRIHNVFHPTDGSQGSSAALTHALRICIASGASLSLMRLAPDDRHSSDDAPDVAAILNRWKSQRPSGEAIPEISVRRHAVRGDDPVRSCLKSLETNPAELIVVAIRPYEGKMAWLGKPVAETLARSSGEMTLLMPEGAAGFVRPDDGGMTLKNILIPVAAQPRPEPAIEAVRRLMLSMPEVVGTATLLHVGDSAGVPEVQRPEMPGWRWDQIVRSGEIVDAILQTATDLSADLIVMTTKGRHSFLDALRGSTTERVLREAQRPVLTMPVGSFLG